jgi:cytochrome c peroxidase
MNRIATLGRVLFYDGHLSVNNAISCGSCHKQAFGFADNTTFSAGYEGRLTGRNSPGISSLSSFGSLFWDGRENVLQNLVFRPVTNHVEMGIDDLGVLPGKLAALPYYRQLFTDAYKGDNITLDRMSGAIALFMQSIGQRSTQTRFDEYLMGRTSVLTGEELDGMILFDTKYNCASCHRGGGSYYGNNTFRDIGLDPSYTDAGRAAITGRDEDRGTFKVPNLRNVAITGPYMHDGRYKTLDDVLEHYSRNIRNSKNLDTMFKDNTGNVKHFNISARDKKAMVAFMQTFTDHSTATDPKFSNPFKLK